MTTLNAHLEEYLRLRRSLGFQLNSPGRFLPTLIEYIDAAGAETITTDLAIAWAKLPQDAQPLHWRPAQRGTRIRQIPTDDRSGDRGPSSRRLRSPPATPDALSLVRRRYPAPPR